MCPCGSGKKLKFCCSDLVGDIEKIHRMIEGDQPRAAVPPHRTDIGPASAAGLPAGPEGHDRVVARRVGRGTPKRSASLSGTPRQPDRPRLPRDVALGDQPVARGGRGAAARPGPCRARNAGTASTRRSAPWAGRVWPAGESWPPRALPALQAAIVPGDKHAPSRLLVSLNRYYRAAAFPASISLRPPCPADAPWHERFDDAMGPSSIGDWQTAGDRLAVLASNFGGRRRWSKSGGARRRQADERALIAGLHALAASSTCRWTTPSRPRRWPVADVHQQEQRSIRCSCPTSGGPRQAGSGLSADRRIEPFDFDPSRVCRSTISRGRA